MSKIRVHFAVRSVKKGAPVYFFTKTYCICLRIVYNEYKRTFNEVKGDDMLTIKVYLEESGGVASLQKDFPLYKGQYQNKLLNVYVPTAILPANFNYSYIGLYEADSLTNIAEELDEFILERTGRERAVGDIVNVYVGDFSEPTVMAQYIALSSGYHSTVIEDKEKLVAPTIMTASTGVKIGCVATARNGAIVKSDYYSMRFLKNVTQNGVEYALFERKLPQAFTAYAGQGVNAPTMVINAVTIDEETETVLRIITSQTCHLDVMPSTVLDEDPPIEPSELELIISQLAAIREVLYAKQDRYDEALETYAKSIVGAINEVDERNGEQDAEIASLDGSVSDLIDAVSALQEIIVTGEEYIGKITTSSIPSDVVLDNFVQSQTSPSRHPKAGDTVIVILEIEGATDKVYKYLYNGSEWSYFEIPATEPAGEGSLGLVEGTLNETDGRNTKVAISGGQITDIRVKDSNGLYVSARSLIVALETKLANIISGSQHVGFSDKAEKDANGNVIHQTYLTQNAGATKSFVKNYALPRTFNDILYLSSDGFQATVPTEPASGIQFSVTTPVGEETEVFSASYTVGDVEYQISSKNGYENVFFVAEEWYGGLQYSFRLLTEIKQGASPWKRLDNRVTGNFSVGSDIVRVDIWGNFESLAENEDGNNETITVHQGDIIRQTLFATQTSSVEPTWFEVYSNEVFPSTHTLTTHSLSIRQGKLGEIPSFYCTAAYISSGKISFVIDDDAQLFDNTEAIFRVRYSNVTAPPSSTQLVIRYSDQDIRLVTPYNVSAGNATIEDFKQILYSEPTASSYEWTFTGVIKNDGEGDIYIIVNMDDLNDVFDALENTEQFSFTLADGTTVIKNIVVR